MKNPSYNISEQPDLFSHDSHPESEQFPDSSRHFPPETPQVEPEIPTPGSETSMPGNLLRNIAGTLRDLIRFNESDTFHASAYTSSLPAVSPPRENPDPVPPASIPASRYTGKDNPVRDEKPLPRRGSSQNADSHDIPQDILDRSFNNPNFYSSSSARRNTGREDTGNIHSENLHHVRETSPDPTAPSKTDSSARGGRDVPLPERGDTTPPHGSHRRFVPPHTTEHGGSHIPGSKQSTSIQSGEKNSHGRRNYQPNPLSPAQS